MTWLMNQWMLQRHHRRGTRSPLSLVNSPLVSKLPAPISPNLISTNEKHLVESTTSHKQHVDETVLKSMEMLSLNAKSSEALAPSPDTSGIPLDHKCSQNDSPVSSDYNNK